MTTMIGTKATGMPGEPEEQITAEMIEAGATILFSFDTFFEDERAWAMHVYRAMRQAAKTQRVSVD